MCYNNHIILQFLFSRANMTIIKKVLNDVWDRSWDHFFSLPEIRAICHTISDTLSQEDKDGYIIYPEHDAIFKAFTLTSLPALRVIILGQDPYHTKGLAEGLAFSVPIGQKIPPSLRNIYKELERDLAISPPSHGHLAHWATQGVLLLNTTLTVRSNAAHSHSSIGWTHVTRLLISYINAHTTHCVFMLWGNHAQSYRSLIHEETHHILTSAHPSPLSAHRGFVGNNHFSSCNRYLTDHNYTPIDWRIL